MKIFALQNVDIEVIKPGSGPANASLLGTSVATAAPQSQSSSGELLLLPPSQLVTFDLQHAPWPHTCTGRYGHAKACALAVFFGGLSLLAI